MKISGSSNTAANAVILMGQAFQDPLKQQLLNSRLAAQPLPSLSWQLHILT